MLFPCYVLGLGFRVWVSPNCAVNVTEFLFFPLVYITLWLYLQVWSNVFYTASREGSFRVDVWWHSHQVPPSADTHTCHDSWCDPSNTGQVSPMWHGWLCSQTFWWTTTLQCSCTLLWNGLCIIRKKKQNHTSQSTNKCRKSSSLWHKVKRYINSLPVIISWD